jgi:hypothetical protein
VWFVPVETAMDLLLLHSHLDAGVMHAIDVLKDTILI